MIGGNTSIQIQTRTTSKNSIGEHIDAWETVQIVHGFIDMASGDSNYQNYDAKIIESTHIFICDYVELDKSISAENSRVIDDAGKVYDVTYIDDPMNLHKHLEIFLKFTGGQ